MLTIVKLRVLVIVKAVAPLGVLLVMVASLAVDVMVHAKLAVIHPVVQALMHNFKSSLAFLLR